MTISPLLFIMTFEIEKNPYLRPDPFDKYPGRPIALPDQTPPTDPVYVGVIMRRLTWVQTRLKKRKKPIGGDL